MTIGANIKKLRRAQNMKQIVLAKKASVTSGTLSQLERNYRNSASLPVLRRIAKALGVPVTVLLS